MKKVILNLFILLIVVSSSSRAQNKTISSKDTESREVASVHKVMLIPFEPKLYMSQIDMSVNQETKLTAKEIKYKFRDGINEQLFKALKKDNYNVLDLMEDTAKYKKEIESIYQHLTYEFQKVPDQANYKAPSKEKEQKKIEKGQINVETNDQNRFMNAKITSPKLVPLLYGKFKTDIFIFVNQLDIMGSEFKGPSDLGTGSGNRKIIVHYTVYTLDAKEINSGIAEQEFENTINNPKKIIDKYFSKIAMAIVERMNKQLALIPAKK